MTVDYGGDFGTDIAVDPHGEPCGYPCMVYYDALNGDLKYAEMADFPYGYWTTVTVDAGGPTGSDDVGRYPAIAIHPASGRRHVSYYDATNGDLMYATCSDNCTDPYRWSKQVVDNPLQEPNDVGLFTEIAVDAYNAPHISYVDATNQNLKYAFFDVPLQVWRLGVVEYLTNVLASTSIGVENTIPPRLHISYSDRTAKTLKYAKCSIDCHQTSNWSIETVPDSWDDVGLWNSIAVGLADTVHISYSASDALCSFKALKYAKGKP